MRIACEVDGKRRHRKFIYQSYGRKIHRSACIYRPERVNLIYIAEIWGSYWIREVMGLEAEFGVSTAEALKNLGN